VIGPEDIDFWLTQRNWADRYGADVEAEFTDLFEAVLVTEGVDVGQAHLKAVAWAKAGQPKFITGVEETTLEAIRGLVSQSIKNGDSLGTLKKSIRDDQTFSAYRASMIGRTETTKALRTGKKEAASLQGRDEQLWQTNSPAACSECQANEDVGWISMDESFPNGDDVHPQCECSVTYRTAALHEED
jgi:hypothetical protein